ncbi:MAG TPA: hypothetical protein PLU80_10535 [Acidobacteriota bacterium]|nr:hypothetical protein [Acidobacteriota bacterium]
MNRKQWIRVGCLIFCLMALMTAHPHVSEPTTATEDRLVRIQFQIRAVEESARQRAILSESLIEGPPGTDFDITLQDDLFRLKAQFVTDVIAPGRLKIRGTLTTKRLYGRSERQVPLYEEDSQVHSLQIGFDEAMVLFPFGRNGGDEVLKIEITPHVIEASGPSPNLVIKPIKTDLNGNIDIQARTVPHKFLTVAQLTKNGVVVAEGKSGCWLEEPQSIQLVPLQIPNAPAVPGLVVDFTVNQVPYSQPNSTFGVNFDIRGTDQKVFARNWRGVGEFGTPLQYTLPNEISVNDGEGWALKLIVQVEK